MVHGSNAFADWLWKDLYVWPQGRLGPSGYLAGLFRIALVYVFAAQILSVFMPTLIRGFRGSEPTDLFTGVMWGQIGAMVLVAFPVWSLFQRRLNDTRPDIRMILTRWKVAFPLFLVGLISLMIAHAAGFETPFDTMDLSRIRFWFVVMLFGSALVPGGDAVPAKAKPAPAAARPDDLFQTSVQKASREAIAVQLARKPAGRHLPVTHSDRPKPAAASFPAVIERGRRLPEQGRVKPGWFS